GPEGTLVRRARPCPACADDLEDFDVEALSLGFREDFLLPFIQRLDLFVDALNALDEGANALAGDRCRMAADLRCSGPLPTILRFLNDTTVPGARLPSTVRRRPVPVST